MPRWGMVAVLVVLGLVWRLWLVTDFYGWEESDYGNLAMIWGVLESGFTRHELDHMPLYYALGAAVMAVLGDAVLAAGTVSLVAGVLALGLSVGLADKVFGRRVAVIAGLLMVVQPEFALYSASYLREPLYAAFVMWMLWELVSERPWRAGFAAMGGFLVRFDGALSLGFVLLGWVAMRRSRWRERARALVPLLMGVLGWATYYYGIEGTWAFWSHAAQTNVETGLGEEATSPWSWVGRGFVVVAALLVDLLPSRIGWGVTLGVCFLVMSQFWKRTDGERLWALAVVGLLGCWLGIGLVAQHEPNHNLYWKWLCPIIPVLVPPGVAQLLRWTDRLAPYGWLGAHALLVFFIGQAAWSEVVETERQLLRSQVINQPQLELAQWIEAQVPESIPVLVDNIPGRYLERRHHSRRLHSWMDMEIETTTGFRTPDGSEADFVLWLEQSEVGYVFWTLEWWTEAPRVAPFLRPCDWPDDRGTGVCADDSERGWSGNGFALVEQERDVYCGEGPIAAIDEQPYCWVFYRVVRGADVSNVGATGVE